MTQARRLLLDLYHALAAAVPPARAAAATARAAAWGLALDLRCVEAPGAADRMAVQLVHRLELLPAQLCVWIGPLVDSGGAPALQAALVAAPLIAGRDGRALLAAALAGDGAEERLGALIDSETCARIALAGADIAAGARPAAELLRLAGDLVPLPVAGARARGAPRAVLAALRLGAEGATRPRAAPHGGSPDPVL